MTQRERIEVDVLIVGAGPAGLAAAIRLRQLAAAAAAELTVMVVEKAAEIGHHGISGAVLDPSALDELLPDWRASAPLEAPVASDALWLLTERGKVAAPFVPPAFDNRGKYVVSLQKLAKWLGSVAEEHGADVFPAFAAQQLLLDGERVVGVRIGDKGIDREGRPKPNYEPGPDLMAKVTILAEGPRGTLAKQAIAALGLDAGREPQVYALGIKELWQAPQGRVQPGSVVHTLGWPLPNDVFGGGFVYGMRDDVLDVGFVVGLDYRDPATDPHRLFQRFKTHPAIGPMLEGATLLRYGAKSIPEGGLFAMPRLEAAGVMLVGDSAGFLDGMRLKGIHLAMKSGMLAAETTFAQLTGACDPEGFTRRFRESWAYRELHRARNVHQGFARGLYAGVLNAGLASATGGRGFGIVDRLAGREGFAQMRPAGRVPDESEAPRFDGVLTVDKMTDVYHSGTKHDEDQPAHLVVADASICAERCTIEYGNPCRHFCPAGVYEPLFTKTPDGIAGRLQINFTNCVHCKACDIIDPYQIITWVPPQGGDGPVYTGL